MDFLDSLSNKPVQNEDRFAYNPSMLDRQVVVRKFRMSDISLDFVIGTKTNPEYNFKEQFVNKIIQANPGFSEDAINGIATTAAIIDRELIPTDQKKNYNLSLKGNHKRFEELKNEAARKKHLAVIICSAKLLEFKQLISDYVVRSVSYRLDDNALCVKLDDETQLDIKVEYPDSRLM